MNELDEIYQGSEFFMKTMQEYYKKYDRIRHEQKTWFPVPDMLITKLIDLEIKDKFGNVAWKYDNAPKSLGDFGEEEPYGNYDYDQYKNTLTLIVNYRGKKEIEGFDKETKKYTLPGTWLWDMKDVNASYF